METNEVVFGMRSSESNEKISTKDSRNKEKIQGKGEEKTSLMGKGHSFFQAAGGGEERSLKEAY